MGKMQENCEKSGEEIFISVCSAWGIFGDNVIYFGTFVALIVICHPIILVELIDLSGDKYGKCPYISCYVSIISKPKNLTIGSKSLSSCNNVSWWWIQKVPIMTSMVFLTVTPFLLKNL